MSWTQMNMQETNEFDYFRFYIKQPRDVRPTNPGMEYGKKLSDALEVDGLTGDMMLDMAIAQIPRLEIVEHEIQVDFMGSKGIVPMLCQLDFCAKDHSKFHECKTHNEKYPWTKKKVDDSDQITYYTTGIWLKTKQIPKDIVLVGIPTTKHPDGQIEALGTVYTIKTTRTLVDCMKMRGRIERAWYRKLAMRSAYEAGTLSFDENNKAII